MPTLPLHMRSCIAFVTLGFALATTAGCAPVTGDIALSGSQPALTGWRSEVVVSGLAHPWSVAWLPDGRMLITERPGRLRLVSAEGVLDPNPVQGVPEVFANGQGGLMEVSLHPDFANNATIYLTYSAGTREANRTVMSRARLDGSTLRDVEQIFAVSQTKSGGQHFGSRIAWMNDGTMLLAIGDGGNPPVRLDGELIRNRAQDKNAHFGKILRLNADGTPAAGNPFAVEEGIAASVFSYGHRNIQGLAIDSATGTIWATEHGARGGDELNKITPAANYGWPTVTYSREYAGPRISEKTSQDGMTDPAVVWTPAIAPSGLTIYTGDRFPQWKGDLFAGGLVTSEVRRIDLDGDRIVGETTMRFDARVRDVRTGPDGFLYVLTDEPQGRLLRILPQ